MFIYFRSKTRISQKISGKLYQSSHKLFCELTSLKNFLKVKTLRIASVICIESDLVSDKDLELFQPIFFYNFFQFFDHFGNFTYNPTKPQVRTFRLNFLLYKSLVELTLLK